MDSPDPRSGPANSPEEAGDIAQRLWLQAAGDLAVPVEVAIVAADGLCAKLRVGLERWIGADGYGALLARAVDECRDNHPALLRLSCLGEDGPALREAASAHGAEAVATAMIAVITRLIESLARILGEEIAMRLVDQVV